MNQKPSFMKQAFALFDRKPSLSNEEIYKELIAANPELNPNWIRNTASSYRWQYKDRRRKLKARAI